MVVGGQRDNRARPRLQFLQRVRQHGVSDALTAAGRECPHHVNIARAVRMPHGGGGGNPRTARIRDKEQVARGIEVGVIPDGVLKPVRVGIG